jgi:hypothetical protein
MASGSRSVSLGMSSEAEKANEIDPPLEPGGRALTRPTAAELLETPGALLSRTHLYELGYERRAVDAIFRGCAVVSLPGYSRPLIRVRDYLAFLEENTYDGSRVR